MYVIPKPGLVVIDPDRMDTPEDRLPPEGREVQESMYWTRRVIDGDVVLGAPSAAEEPQSDQA